MNILFKGNDLGPGGGSGARFGRPTASLQLPWGLPGVSPGSPWGLLGVSLEESHFFEKVSLAAARARFLGPGAPPRAARKPRGVSGSVLNKPKHGLKNYYPRKRFNWADFGAGRKNVFDSMYKIHVFFNV